MITETFFACDYAWHLIIKQQERVACDILTEWPVVRAISFKFEKTTDIVKGFGLDKTFWLLLEFCCKCEHNKNIYISTLLTIATSPRSPSFFRSALICAMFLPVEFPMAFTSKLSPIPNSIPS